MESERLPPINWPKAIQTKFLPRLPGFAARGRLLYERPAGDILRAFFIDVSAFGNRAVYVQCFVLPLYVPRQALSFDFGRRLRDPSTHSERWDANDNALARMAAVMKADGVPFLRQVSDVTDLSNLLGTTLGSMADPHTIEALAYSRLLAGARDRSSETLITLAGSLDLTVEWQREMSRRVYRILSLLGEGTSELARNQLARWRELSLTRLELH